ncbi:hypothetical protein AAES_164946 [Amazona aestiva]|uniref:Uncharacterized protein n=1 Tax=Amazona aestiva TaxID=12930 RepID=A0A0Q3LTE4_AMAAE|nr:hypothetical protein AAES_164946 [Amazona aestiva]
MSNGQGCTLRSLVEVLLQRVAELQEAVTRLKGVREAEGKQHCLLRDQTVLGPRASTVAHAGKEAANPGSWEKVVLLSISGICCTSGIRTYLIHWRRKILRYGDIQIKPAGTEIQEDYDPIKGLGGELTHPKTLWHKGYAEALLEQVMGTFSLAEECVQKSNLFLNQVN